MTQKERYFRVANLLFLILMGVQFLPDRTTQPSQSLYVICFAAGVEVLVLLVSTFLKKKKGLTLFLDIVAFLYGLLIVWTLVTAKFNWLKESLFPPPGRVFAQVLTDWDKLLINIASSMGIILQGYLLAAVIAIPLGLFLGWSVRLGSAATYIAKFLSAIPPIVYIPYGIALLPTFQSVSVFVIFLAAFWPVLPAGCMSAVGFNFPQLCFGNNAIISTFAGTASMLTGIEAGLRAQGITAFQAVGFAGDGGTADIGIQALSGAIDRNDNILYICYDNEAYMNTGIQKSSLTPYGATTTTTPLGSQIRGNLRPKKNMFEIVCAHNIPYAATASVGYLPDFIRKVEKAAAIPGTKYIHVLSPCPVGWGIPSEETIAVAREVVDCGLWYLAEFENGEFTLNRKPKKFTDVAAYLKKQRRFRHLTEEEIKWIESSRDEKWEAITANWKQN